MEAAPPGRPEPETADDPVEPDPQPEAAEPRSGPAVEVEMPTHPLSAHQGDARSRRKGADCQVNIVELHAVPARP